MNTAMSQKIWLLILTTTFGYTFLLPHKLVIAQVKNELPNTLGKPTRTVQSGTRLRLKLPPVGSPGRRVPGASRGTTCLARNQRLKALLPQSNIGLTTVANPTLYFFIPQTSAATMELVIQNEEEEIIYQQNYKPSLKAGIVGLSLPPNSLAVDKIYRWNLSIICNPENRSQDKTIEGAIKRVNNPSLMKKLRLAKPYERLRLYAEAGIWYEALDTLAKLRSSQPNDLQLKADWEYLLTAPGVEIDKQLVQEPLISKQQAPQPIESQKQD